MEPVDDNVVSPKVKEAVEQDKHVMRVDAWDLLMKMIYELTDEEKREFMLLTGGITGNNPH
jgi:hypothetical protein